MYVKVPMRAAPVWLKGGSGGARPGQYFVVLFLEPPDWWSLAM